MINGLTIDALEGFDRNEAIAAGYSTAKVNEWSHLHEVYYGPTKANQQRAKARKRALAGRFTLDQLTMIEKALKAIPHHAARMRMRLRLLATRLSYNALRSLIKQLVPKEDAPPEKGVRFSKSRDRTRSVTVTADERDIADLEHLISQNLDPNAPASPQMLARFLDVLRDGVSVPRSVPRPLLLVPLPDYARILRGKGDDTVLALTDATTITGAEFLNRYVANANFDLEAALFHPQEGPVNLYRTQRFANRKQRDLARATMPVCPVPGCRHGADSCEIHHIQAWQHGGETNLDNLSPLCRYHNGTNDDNPTKPRRGRIENIGGAPTWVSPRGFATPNPYHPYAPGRNLFRSGASCARAEGDIAETHAAGTHASGTHGAGADGAWANRANSAEGDSAKRHSAGENGAQGYGTANLADLRADDPFIEPTH